MLKKYLNEVHDRMQEHCLIVAILCGVILTLLCFLYNLTVGPLYNMNDIGNWSNRLLFVSMTAVVQASLMAFLILEDRAHVGRLLVREVLISVSLIIFFLAINQKTYAYNTQLQPIVRQMDTRGLLAAKGAGVNLSVPALTLLYLITRGPIYDMYLAKLFCIACYELLCIVAMHLARGYGREHGQTERAWLPEVVLCLTLILPQGFLSAACAAQIEVAGALLVVLAYIQMEEGRKRAALILYGVGCAICTACWFLLPVWLLRQRKWKVSLPEALLPLGVALLLCVPGALLGCGTGSFASLLTALTEVPLAASGVPNLVSIFPRALMEEIPEYPRLQTLPALDMVTRAAENYTQAHFEILVHGLSIAGAAVFLGLSAFEIRRNVQKDSWLCVCLTLSITAALCTVSATMGTWMLVSVLCILAAVVEPGLRLPCGLVIFALMAGSGYPVAGETMLKPVYVDAVVFAALGMLLGLWPGKGIRRTHD